MKKMVREKVEAVVGPFIEKKSRAYAKKFNWSEAYRRKAVRWMQHGAAEAVREAEAKGEKIEYPVALAKYAALQSLKRGKAGQLVIPYWKRELRTGSGVITTYADRQEAL